MKYLNNLLAAALVGCLAFVFTSANTQAQSSKPSTDSHYGITPVITRQAARKIGFTNFWLSDLGLPTSQHITSISEIGNVLYITESPTPLLSAISVDNGRILWRRLVGRYGQRIYAPVKYKNSLYINSQTHIYKIDIKSGKINRSADIPDTVSTKGALSGNKIIFGSPDGTILAVNLNSYQVDWSYKLPAPITANPVTANGEVVVGDTKGHYALFSAESGNFKWQRQAFDAINVSPLIHNKTVFVASKDRTLYAENIANGKDRWLFRSELAFTAPPRIVDNILYEVIHGEQLVAINPENGDKLWSKKGGGQPAIITSGNLLVNTYKKIELVNTDNGFIKESVKTELPVQSAAPGPKGSAILISPRGVILRINPRK